AAAMRVSDDDTIGIDRRLRRDAELLHIALVEDDVDLLGLLRGGGGGLVAGGNEGAVDHAPLRGAGAGPAGEGFQNADGAAGSGGREHVVLDVDGPGAAADRNA